LRVNPEADRRKRRRSLCSELVEVSFVDQSGREFAVTGLLEDVAQGGACINSSVPVSIGRPVHLRTRDGEWEIDAVVRHCEMKEEGYLLGIQFDAGLEWNRREWRPAHLTAIEE